MSPLLNHHHFMNALSQKVGFSVLCKSIGVLWCMFRETEVLLSVAAVSFSKNVPCLNFSVARILGLIVKSKLVSLKKIFLYILTVRLNFSIVLFLTVFGVESHQTSLSYVCRTVIVDRCIFPFPSFPTLMSLSHT